MVALYRLCRLVRLVGLPQVAFAVDLPSLPTCRVESRKPTAPPTIGVDADKMAEVKHLATFLRGVAYDGRFAGDVWLGDAELQRLPAHRLPVLMRERTVGLVTAVDEEVGIGFEVVAPRADVGDLIVGDWADFSIGATIRFNRRGSAALHPIVGLWLAVQDIEHHFLVVAHQWYQPALLTQLEELLNHLPAFRPAIDTVAQRDERIVGRGLNDFDERAQRHGTTMDITDSNDARGHVSQHAEDWRVFFDCGHPREATQWRSGGVR
jgi:hypothetical protein